MLSTNALAEWTWVGMSSDGDMTIYVDLQIIRKKENKVKMWHIFDFKTVQVLDDNTKYLSSRGLNEYDCENITSKQITFDWFSGNMLNGSHLYEDRFKNQHTVEEIPPGTMLEKLVKIACNKR
jgi:hypothetical protein